jgi:molecular chaperone GrpE (heat shock protein)
MDKITFSIGGVIIEMDKEEASKAFEAGSIELNSDELVTYKKDEFETFKSNLANEEYKKGKTAGAEMSVKDAREKHGYEFDGKSIDNLIEAVKTKTLAEAKVEPSKKIQELETNFNSLQTNYNTLRDEYDGYKTKISEKETQHRKDSTLMSFIPDNIKVDKDIALMALKSKAGIDVSFDDTGRAIQTINGEVQKDKSLEPIGLTKDFMTEQLSALGLVENKASGGRGGSDEPGGGSGDSYEAFTERMKANGIEPGSEKFSEHMTSELKAGTLKM